MSRYPHALLAFLLATSLLMCDRSAAQSAHDAVDRHSAPATDPVPLYDDLGDHHVSISSRVTAAQDYFDQGMRLYYAFNHAEAVRAFREAQRRDSNCAICWWGEALAWGPNINLPMDEAAGKAAYAAIQGAMQRRAYASKRERALIDALAVRYVAKPGADRFLLDQAYSDTMSSVADQYPQDQEIAVLYAESLMDLRPWDYWAEDGAPNPGIAEALASLNSVIAVNEKHPGACHFYIHAVEKLYPERAIGCAERLAKLMPGAGHLVHMPGHIYIRVGRYLDAVEANKHAIHADETYIQDQNPAMGMYTAGYYPHNYDFMAFATMMIGRSDDSISAAETVSRLLPAELFGSPAWIFSSTGPSGHCWYAFDLRVGMISWPAPHQPSHNHMPERSGITRAAAPSRQNRIIKPPQRSSGNCGPLQRRRSWMIFEWSSIRPPTCWPLQNWCWQAGWMQRPAEWILRQVICMKPYDVKMP